MKQQIIMLVFWSLLFALHTRLAAHEIVDGRPWYNLIARAVFLVLCSAYIVKNAREIWRGRCDSLE